MNTNIEALKLSARTDLIKKLDAYAWNRRGLAKFKSRPLESDESVTGYFKQLDGSVSSAEFDNLEQPIKTWTSGCDQQAALLRTFAMQHLFLGVLTEAQYRAIIGELDGTASTVPIINLTVRPVVDMTGDKEVVRDRAGKIVGMRSVDRLNAS